MKKNITVLVLTGMLLLSGCSAPQKSERPQITGAVEETAAENLENALPLEKGDVDSGEAKWSENYDQLQGEEYLQIEQNSVVNAEKEPLTSFSLKVDTASFNNVKRYIESRNWPPADAVKTEELINYFSYEEEMKDTESPFSIYTEIGDSPFDKDKKLAFIRVKTDDIAKEELPDSNLVFLIDTSGSMDSYDKLPLLKSAFQLLADNLGENDRVSIVTYAGSSEIVLDSVSGADKKTIMNAIETLRASGSTAGADGINTAYKLAEKNFKENGNNRIILASDGDFNVGLSSLTGLEKLISKKKENGVYFSVLGFGTGNLQDATMETLATYGNGNYSYIDSVSAAKKVLVDEMGSNLFVAANDVKAQIEFNPNVVKTYRLIGYENRKMTNEEFLDDKKDAGEIGVGTDVAVLVELDLTDEAMWRREGEELFKVRIRYKNPGEDNSQEITEEVNTKSIKEENSSDYKFASAVAMFGELLRNSEYGEDIKIEDIIDLAMRNLGEDYNGYRKEFIEELMILKNVVR